MADLARARITVGIMPFARWRDSLGASADWIGDRAPNEDLATALTLAAHIERAARRAPFKTNCLPRAVALSWQLRRRSIAHEVVLAARPATACELGDSLHARVDVAGAAVLGDLPGPWLDAARLGA